MPEGILTILKFCFLALLYVFVARVLRVVLRELAEERQPRPAAAREPAGAATPAQRFKLKVLEPPIAKGRLFPLSTEVTVGRAPGCGVVLADDTYASQLHARVYTQDGDVFVEDLGSTNGTYVNRKKISGTARLKRGDRLQVGATVMEVVR